MHVAFVQWLAGMSALCTDAFGDVNMCVMSNCAFGDVNLYPADPERLCKWHADVPA